MMIGQSEALYREFAEKYGIAFSFTPEQYDLFQAEEEVILGPDQMNELIDKLSADGGIPKFLEEYASHIPAVCMSLYVLNDALWKVMERKPWDQEKMLAMTTMPFCFWHQDEEKTSNMKAVKRWGLGKNTLSYSPDRNTLEVRGEGGDFAGFVDRSQITSRKFGIPEKRQIIPNYVFQKVRMVVQLGKARATIHPTPLDNLDYDYSGSAKDFYDHGIHLEVLGEKVMLEIEKRKPTNLNGAVHLFIGFASESEEDASNALLGDIWFWALQRLLQERN
ncbi:MAG: hypothetical protein ACW985_05805 [Candidatus Thorarchaeota archaeon]|jgi:hypothetical protein